MKAENYENKVKPASSKTDMSFDWEHIKQFGFTPASYFKPNLTPFAPPKTAEDLFMGKTPIESMATLAFMIDGIAFNSISQVLVPQVRALDYMGLLTQTEKKLNLKFDNGDFQFLDLSQILSDADLVVLNQWIIDKKQTLLKIANQYEQSGRQFYHFMYDLVALIKAVNRIPVEYRQNIIEKSDSNEILMHNRILAEIANAYLERGSIVKIEPPNRSGTRKPDLSIDGIIGDVKTILTNSVNDRESLSDFAHKLKKNIIEEEIEKNQLGAEGIFFIAPWSGIIGSIFYTFFHQMKVDGIHNFTGANYYHKIPKLSKNQTVFVITSPCAFENGYLVFDTKWVSDIIEDFVEQGYPMIGKYAPMSYLLYTNVKRGCPFGVQGKNPTVMINVR